MKIDTDKLSGVFAILAMLGTLLSSAAIIFEQIQPKYGAACLVASAAIAHFTKRLHHVLPNRRRKVSTKTLSIFLAGSLLCTMTACPQRSDLVKAFNASEKIASYTEIGARAVGDLFEAKVIDYETKEKLVAKLKIVARNGRRFHETLVAIKAQYGATLPDREVNALDIVFNRDVIAPLADLLTETGLLSENASSQILTALVFLKSAVLTVAKLFGQLRPNQSASYEFYKQEQLTA
jgi:hypothetical protein